jgi:hypothetical protein
MIEVDSQPSPVPPARSRFGWDVALSMLAVGPMIGSGR